jgi:phenylalanyl-tRNA synthetase beta chain
MKFSEQWLREWVNPPVFTERLVEQLTLAGLEVESLTPAASRFSGVVVAEVKEVKPHPQAEHLKVCAVDCGAPKPINIVCGADNVRTGLRVPLARLGAELPGSKRIERAELRGVVSEGMLCSAAELGLAESAAGLMELPPEAPLGEEIWGFLALEDVSMELSLTPNRGDCLGVAGIAREVGVLNRLPVTGLSVAPVTPEISDEFPVEILAPAACPRYVGRVVHGVNPKAQTPIWMRERLRRSGLRSISPIVDVTNYVMLELGQPMHAFDLGQLSGGIRVRFANEGEHIVLLDGQELILSADTLVIADHNRALAIAGIMGGLGSGVTENTQDVFLESAFFSPETMAGQARRYKLQTDSSYRFERGVDFELQARAVERATELLVTICGGRPGPVLERCSQEHLPKREPITLRDSRIQRLLGMQIPAEQVSDILGRLGMAVEPGSDEWRVTPPAFRFDITMEADLIEELARVGGYDHIPSAAPTAALRMRALSETQVGLPRIRQTLIERGYQEAITYSFVDPTLQARLDPETKSLPLANPISSDMGVMRTSLWPGLIQALIYNLNRQSERIRLFETGLVFSVMGDDTVQQRNTVGLVATGPVLPEQWSVPSREGDFHDIKGDVETLLSLGGLHQGIEYQPTTHPALHPGQSAVVLKEGKTVGLIGVLHPGVARELGIEQPVLLGQLDLAAIAAAKLPRFMALSKFPAIRRDISVVVGKEVTAAQLMRCVADAAPGTLKNLQLFDLYQGEGIDPMKKSLALGLTFQGTSSTLMDEEVDAFLENILSELRQRLGASLRA